MAKPNDNSLKNLSDWNNAQNRKTHPNLCKAKFKHTPDRQCGNFALKGSNYCKFHGGRQAINSAAGVRKQRLNKLPVIYRKYLNKTLHDALEEQLGVKPSEQLQILEELALMRDFAGQSVALYGAAKDKCDSEATLAAGSFMAQMMSQVAKIAETAAKITSSTSDTYSIHDIQYIVFQLIHIMYRVCGTRHENLAVEFERRVHEELVLPKQPEGTAKEPHEDVDEMDAMVPRIEQNGKAE